MKSEIKKPKEKKTRKKNYEKPLKIEYTFLEAINKLIKNK